MDKPTINYDDSKAINRNRSLGIIKQRIAFRIILQNGNEYVKHYYSEAQARGHAIFLSMKQGCDGNKAIIHPESEN